MMDYMDHGFGQCTVATGFLRGTKGLRHDYYTGIDYWTLLDIEG